MEGEETMRAKQVTQYEGELLGPIDWSHNFSDWFDSWCVSETTRRDMLFEQIELLWQIERAHLKGERIEVLTGFGSDYWYPLLGIGMYDGWPWWKPMPSICVYRVLGAEWHQKPKISAWRPAPRTARGE